MSKFKVGQEVRVARINPGSHGAKVKCLGVRAKILRPSKVGANQFGPKDRWVLDGYETIWFDANELELVKDIDPPADNKLHDKIEKLEQANTYLIHTLNQKDIEITQKNKEISRLKRKIAEIIKVAQDE